ncbi:tetratricopeptide (TPR) repeat protein/transcriptional regulator with XRE-family HTH domain [Kibdelosporangium banguiense]|uniref:Tetratricopeptide (TPR) repeat protein/transcriptional regulator with XRE-family HTH domain n=1 Tax=Kibdelosporangium banguiense TaxID=1365924 RepID=A0ABS4TLE0_9PSEU|nr:XRE family transcriptional regulator [Kibdelosporangium banguiense]MBP2324819.1 tetratricopeptide (TPR) repeat protein/transcriptional regulator with XRE-family HTH domain [Kibdelosporangium banguiense]
MSDTGPEAVREPGDNFGDLLARYRRSARLTQEELASASGISARSISDMERGRVRVPQRRSVQALASALTLDTHAQWEFVRLAKAGRVRTGTRPTGTAATPSGRPQQCQLPPEVADFTGRDNEVEQTLQLVGEHLRTNLRATPVVVLFGAPGVGKTSFAVHIGHRVGKRYPDGRVFVNMRGIDTNPLSAHDALGQLLAAMGVAAAHLPTGVHGRSTLYRQLLSERRMLVILDNVADDAQVRPLLPGSSGSLVLITSRRVLSGLEAVGRIQLDVLDAAAGVRLLESIIRPDRAARELDAVHRVAELCGNLPLALRIAGNRLASRPRWPIANLVRQLNDEQRRLTALTAGDLQVRAAFEVSYQQCDAISGMVFRRLSLAGGPDVTVAQTAVLAELDETTAERHLEELVDASLLDTDVREGRYILHDLLRLFAGERLAGEDTAADIQAAEWRLTEWLLRNGIRAAKLLAPDWSERDPDAVVDTAEDAVEWLDDEQAHWLAALRQAVRLRWHAAVLEFSSSVRWYSALRKTSDVWREVFTYGVNAARALDRRRDEAEQLNFLGWALNLVPALHHEAYQTHRRALAVAREVGDRIAEAWSLMHSGRAELDDGRPGRSVELLTSAIAVFHQTGHTFEEHIALSYVGLALHALGRYEQAAAAHRTAVGEFRRTDSLSHRNLVATGLQRLAETLEATGDWQTANATFQEAGAIAVGVDSPAVEADAWFGCGRCRHEMGDLRPAERHLDIALSIYTDIGDRWKQARVLQRRASVLDQTRPAHARADREQALEICRGLNTAKAHSLAAALSAAINASEDLS